MYNSIISFAVNDSAVLCNMIDGDIKARMATRNDPEKKQRYKDLGIIDSSPSITKFMHAHRDVFGNRKLIHRDGSNFFGGVVPIATLNDTAEHRSMLRSKMKYEYDLTEEELEGMKECLEDLHSLEDSPEIKEIVKETESYKKSIEKVWRANEAPIMKYVRNVLGYEPTNVGKVNAYIMYPTINTHRSYQLSKDKTLLFFGKAGEKDSNKILAYLTHQAVHQPMLPYKSSMTKKEKEKFHAFIKFLTDKDVYSQLSGKSYLDIVTQNENGELMGMIYPYWLGYRYRNSDKEGMNPEEEIKKAIERDKDYFDKLPLNSRKRKLYSTYNFEKIDPQKVADLFREKRGITPYEFAKLDFEDKTLVYQNKYLKSRKLPTSPNDGSR